MSSESGAELTRRLELVIVRFNIAEASAVDGIHFDILGVVPSCLLAESVPFLPRVRFHRTPSHNFRADTTLTYPQLAIFEKTSTRRNPPPTNRYRDCETL